LVITIKRCGNYIIFVVITIKTMITRELYLKQLLNYIDKPIIKIIADFG